MVSSSGSGNDFVLNFVLWMFVPSFLTSFLLGRYYQLKYPKNSSSSPKPGSSSYKKDYDFVYCLVIGSYLVYCVINVIYSSPPNYYSQFGLDKKEFDVKDLKARYKTFSLQFHPDKNPSEKAAVEFSHMKDVYETLGNPLKRKIYENFGTFSCNGCVTFRDYFYRYLPDTLMFYGGTALVLIILNVAGKRDYAQSLRYITILCLMAVEVYMVSRDENEFFSSILLASKTTHQKLCPILFPDKLVALNNEYKKCEELSGIVDKEMKIQAMNSFEPFNDHPEVLAKLKRQIEKASVELKLFETDETFRKKYLQALIKRRG